MFRFYNANEKNRFVDDCTIRAISLAEDKTWNETYKKLSNLARRRGMMMDSVKFIEDYLDERYDRVYSDDKSVGQFVENHPRGIYLLTMNNHISIAIDGFIYDTFDCSDRVLKMAWLVEE